MIDTKSLFDQFVGSGVAGGLAGGLAGGALANALSGKKAKKLAGSALQLGGLALVGGLAYKAWQNHQQKAQLNGADAAGARAPAPSPPAQSAFLPDANDKAGADALSLLLVRAVISAAKADGQIDTRESQDILNKINALELPDSDKAALFDEYAKPLNVAGLVAAVDSPEHAAEVYAASLLTVDPASPAEKIYLDTLARELRLDAGLVAEIHATVQTEPAAA